MSHVCNSKLIFIPRNEFSSVWSKPPLARCVRAPTNQTYARAPQVIRDTHSGKWGNDRSMLMTSAAMVPCASCCCCCINFHFHSLSSPSSSIVVPTEECREADDGAERESKLQHWRRTFGSVFVVAPKRRSLVAVDHPTPGGFTLTMAVERRGTTFVICDQSYRWWPDVQQLRKGKSTSEQCYTDYWLADW